MMLDLKLFELRARDIYSKQTLARKIAVLRLYDRFLVNSNLGPGLDSLNIWLDELSSKGLSKGSLTTYGRDVLSYFDLMLFDLDQKKLRLIKRRLPPYSIGSASFLTEEEVSKLLTGTMNKVHKLIYSLMYCYARRLSEVLSLKGGMINLKDNKITFRISKKRQDEYVTYDIEPWLKDTLAERLKEVGSGFLFPLTHRAVEIAFKKDCKRLGIEPMNRRLAPHILRHSRCTHLRKRKVPLDVISRHLVRHTNYSTTVAFYLGMPEEVVAEIPPAEEVLKR